MTLDSEEMADRVAIRELIDAYAYCADRRDAKGLMALFTPDTHFVIYMDAKRRSLRRTFTAARLSLLYSRTWTATE